MTIRRTSTLHDLIRGGDTWRHQLRMLFASLGLSLLVGLVIALAVAWTQYARATHPRARRSEPHQARWRAVAAWVGNVRCAAHGVVGAGKTLAIREQLDVICGERKRALVYDPTGELIATYFRDGLDVLLHRSQANCPRIHGKSRPAQR